MAEEMPRNLIHTAGEPQHIDEEQLEKEWLANNVPAERLELHWRYESGAVQLYDRRLRSLAAYGVGPALRSYLRARLEWFCDNKLYAQPRGIVVVIVETNGDVDMKLGEPVAAPALSEENLVFENDQLAGANVPGALFARKGDKLHIVAGDGLRDACESFAADLAKTLAKSLGYAVVEGPFAKGDLEGAELLLVNEEFGEAVVEGHSGPFTDKLLECFDKLWSKGK